jgi:hypothetical protein
MLNDFDFVVYSFQHSCMNEVIAVIQNTIAIVLNSVDKLLDFWMFGALGQSTPLFERLYRPGSGFIGPNLFQLISQDQNSIDHFFQLQRFPQIFPFRFLL